MWLRIYFVLLQKKLSNNENELISDLNSRLRRNFQLEMALYIVFLVKVRVYSTKFQQTFEKTYFLNFAIFFLAKLSIKEEKEVVQFLMNKNVCILQSHLILLTPKIVFARKKYK